MSNQDLTPTERRIVQIIMSGTTNLKGIAKEIGVSFYHIRQRLNDIYRKYGVHDMVSLAIAVRFEHLSERIAGFADPLLCECGARAVWRATVVIYRHPETLLMCDTCRLEYKGKVEPAIVVLTNEQYAALHDLVVRKMEPKGAHVIRADR